MKYQRLFLIIFTTFILSLGASEAKKAIEKRIDEIKSQLVIAEGEECAKAVVTAVASSASGIRTGEEVYNNACATCHSIGLAGAPKFADLSSWGSRPDEGIEHLTEQVKNGLNGMPPMGMCMDCADEELTAAVQHMLDSL